jgi:hypothetical protein
MPAEAAGIRKEAGSAAGRSSSSSDSREEKQGQPEMNNRKARFKQNEAVRNTKEVQERLDQVEAEIAWKLEALEAIFSQSKDDPEAFHTRYVKPLLEEELGLETALELLVAGIIRPN